MNTDGNTDFCSIRLNSWTDPPKSAKFHLFSRQNRSSLETNVVRQTETSVKSLFTCVRRPQLPDRSENTWSVGLPTPPETEYKLTNRRIEYILFNSSVCHVSFTFRHHYLSPAQAGTPCLDATNYQLQPMPITGRRIEYLVVLCFPWSQNMFTLSHYAAVLSRLRLMTAYSTNQPINLYNLFTTFRWCCAAFRILDCYQKRLHESSHTSIHVPVSSFFRYK